MVVQALENVAEDGDAKARGYLCSIRQFDFNFALCATEHVLSNTVALSTTLQGQSIDLIEAAKKSRVVIGILRDERNDRMVWNELSLSVQRSWQQVVISSPACQESVSAAVSPA